MKYPIQLIKKAREMRLSGQSLSEISKETNISRSALSVWFKDITLSHEQKEVLGNRVKNKISRGRMNASISIRASRMYREKKVFDDAEKEFKNFIKNPFFGVGVVLYWINGVKKGSSFQFANSNPEAQRLMLKWITKYIKTPDSVIKTRSYHGYKRIDICDINVLRKMIAWQKLLIQYYKEVTV